MCCERSPPVKDLRKGRARLLPLGALPATSVRAHRSSSHAAGRLASRTHHTPRRVGGWVRERGRAPHVVFRAAHFWKGAPNLAPSRHTAHGWRKPPCLTNVSMALSRCPLTTSPSSLSVHRESTNVPAGPRTHSTSDPLWSTVVMIDPRKIAKNGASFTVGCNVCEWEATFGEGEGGLFFDVEEADKARRVHCGSNESMAGVPRCSMLEQGYDWRPANQLVRVCSFSRPPSLPTSLLPPSFLAGTQEAARLLQASRRGVERQPCSKPSRRNRVPRSAAAGSRSSGSAERSTAVPTSSPCAIFIEGGCC